MVTDGWYPTKWIFDDGYFKANDSGNVFVFKNTNDPYGTSKTNYRIGLVGKDADTSICSDAHPVKVKVSTTIVG